MVVLLVVGIKLSVRRRACEAIRRDVLLEIVGLIRGRRHGHRRPPRLH